MWLLMRRTVPQGFTPSCRILALREPMSATAVRAGSFCISWLRCGEQAKEKRPMSLLRRPWPMRADCSTATDVLAMGSAVFLRLPS